MAFQALTRIRFDHVDGAGILYYPRYFHLFHLAFEDFFNDFLGRPYADLLQRERIGFPAVRAEADYHKPLRFGDAVAIEVLIAKIGHKSVDFVYRVKRPEETDLVAEGTVTSVAVDLDRFVGVPIPDDLRRVFEDYARDNPL